MSWIFWLIALLVIFFIVPASSRHRGPAYDAAGLRRRANGRPDGCGTVRIRGGYARRRAAASGAACSRPRRRISRQRTLRGGRNEMFGQGGQQAGSAVTQSRRRRRDGFQNDAVKPTWQREFRSWGGFGGAAAG